MTRQIICEGPCNGDAVRQYDAAQRRGDLAASIEISRRLVHTPPTSLSAASTIGLTFGPARSAGRNGSTDA